MIYFEINLVLCQIIENSLLIMTSAKIQNTSNYHV